MKKTISMLLLAAITVLSLSACSSAALVNSTGALFKAAAATSEQNQQPNPGSPRLIRVTGTGVNLVTPDIAMINVGVQVEDKEVAKAIDDNIAKSQKIKDTLVSMGVDQKDIQTQDFSVYVIQKYDTENKPTGSAYQINNTVAITIRDLSKIGKILGEVTRAGANNIYGIRFDLSDKSKASDEARNLALKDAARQAAEVAKVMNVELGEVYSITISNYNAPVFPEMGKGGGEGIMASAANVPISSGQYSISVSTEVAYFIK